MRERVARQSKVKREKARAAALVSLGRRLSAASRSTSPEQERRKSRTGALLLLGGRFWYPPKTARA
eukprot:7081683-Pyramimonas_sp.AAC.1